MKIIYFFGNSTLKFVKGLALVYLILIAVWTIQSCSKTNLINNNLPAKTFLESVKKQSEILRTISVKPISTNNLNNTTIKHTSNSVLESIESEQTIFIRFTEMPINPNYSYDISGMANLVTNYNGILSYEQTSNSYTFNVPLTSVANTLNPLISEAKIYLNARGLTNEDIQIMIVEEGGTEFDLVPFATTLAEYEVNGNGNAYNDFKSLFIQSANAGEVLHCAAVALGVDALWALGGSNAATWSKAAIKKAFGAVAKRALGPIGAAITIASFGLCMGDWLP